MALRQISVFRKLGWNLFLIVGSVFMIYLAYLLLPFFLFALSSIGPSAAVKKATITEIQHTYQASGFDGEISGFSFGYAGVDRTPLVDYIYKDIIDGQDVSIKIRSMGSDWFGKEDFFSASPATSLDELVDQMYDQAYYPLLSYGFQHNSTAKALTEEVKQVVETAPAIVGQFVTVEETSFRRANDGVMPNKPSPDEAKKIIMTLVDANRQSGKTALQGFYDLKTDDLMRHGIVYTAIEMNALQISASELKVVKNWQYDHYLIHLANSTLPNGYYELKFRYVDAADGHHYGTYRMVIALENGQGLLIFEEPHFIN